MIMRVVSKGKETLFVEDAQVEWGSKRESNRESRVTNKLTRAPKYVDPSHGPQLQKYSDRMANVSCEEKSF